MSSTLAERLDGTPPGPVLAAQVAALDPADLDDDALLELAAAAERLASWAAAVQARAVAEQLARSQSSAEAGYVTAGLCLRLGATRYAADKRVRLAVACDRHPLLAAALRDGVLDSDKALALAETGQMPDSVRALVITSLLPRAETLTHRQLAEQVRRAELVTDPDGAEDRHRRARADRSVRFDPADSTMAWITAHLPADDAVRVWATVDAAARAMRAVPGESRTLDQCRADALVALTTGQLVLVGAGDAAGSSDADADADADRRADGAADRDDDVAGWDDDASRRGADTLAGRGDGAAGGRDDDGASRRGADALAGRGDGAAGGRDDVAMGGSGNGAAHGLVSAAPPVPAVRVPVVQVGVLVAATTLAGLDDLPGEIAGYGPVPADVAAAMAQLGDQPGDTTWRRLLTDPVSGTLTDYSTRAYRPGRILRAAVEARDRTCTFIGCRQPAHRCEHDHLTPYDHQHPDRLAHGHGQTCAHNLHALCKHHHQLKTAGVVVPTRDPRTGSTVWMLTATGHTATREDDPLHPEVHARRLRAERAGPEPGRDPAPAPAPASGAQGDSPDDVVDPPF